MKEMTYNLEVDVADMEKGW